MTIDQQRPLWVISSRPHINVTPQSPHLRHNPIHNGPAMAVTRTLLDVDASRKRRSEVVDKMAPGYILQGALDRLARIPT